MKRFVHVIGRILSKVPLVVIVLAAFVLGYVLKGAVSRGPAAPPRAAAPTETGAQEAEGEIWTCSMHPQIRLPEPGQCPICGMDLIPAESPAAKPPPAAAPKKQKKYACSMFCVPPLPNPGQCPICGMEMVEVEDEEVPGGVSGERILTLSEQARRLAEIQTEPVERRFVSAEIRMVGKVDYDETRLGYITAWVPGRLDRLYVDYTGVPVNKGEHMVYMYSPDLLTAQEELLQAIEAARAMEGSGVSTVRGTSQQWIEDIREKLRLWGLTEEQIREIEQRGTPTDHLTIYAPMGGIVIHKNAVEGMYVQTGTRIYTIADLSRVWAKLDAYESDLVWLRYGQEIEFTTEAFPGEVFEGTVAFIDPVLDDKTRTVDVRVNVGNEDGRLKPGMFVRAVARAKVAAGGRVVDAELAGKWMCPMHPEVVKDGPGDCDQCGMPLVRTESLGFVSVETGSAAPPLVIPASAPLITGKRAVVYVELQPGTYQGREVLLGPRAGDHYIVREGLEEGERVVVHGNFKIDSAMQIRAQPSMMSAEARVAPLEKPPAEPQGVETMIQPRLSVTEQGEWEPFKITDAFRKELAPLYEAYFEIREHLSRDRLEDARKSAARLKSLAEEVDMSIVQGPAHLAWMKESQAIADSAGTLSTAADIEAARRAFALLSETIIVVAKRFGPGTGTFYRFHCPMAFDNRGADWLQAEKRLGNPFFGSAMYKCGVLKEEIGDSEAEAGGEDHE